MAKFFIPLIFGLVLIMTSQSLIIVNSQSLEPESNNTTGLFVTTTESANLVTAMNQTLELSNNSTNISEILTTTMGSEQNVSTPVTLMTTTNEAVSESSSSTSINLLQDSTSSIVAVSVSDSTSSSPTTTTTSSSMSVFTSRINLISLVLGSTLLSFFSWV